MPTPPEGAQHSPDNLYWWDEPTSVWQLIDDGQTGANADAPAAGAPATGAGAGASDGQWPPAGYPSDPAEWTAEQLQYWFGNTQDAGEDIALGAAVVDVAAIAALESNTNEGTA